MYYLELNKLKKMMQNPSLSDKEVRLAYLIAAHCQECLSVKKTNVCELSYSKIKEWTGWGSFTTIKKTIDSLNEKGIAYSETHDIGGAQKSTTVYSSPFIISTTETVVPKSVAQTESVAQNNDSATETVVQRATETVENKNTIKNNNKNNGEEGCSFPEKNQKLVGNKYISHCLQEELTEADKAFCALLTKQH